MFKFCVYDRSYTSWEVFETATFQKININDFITQEETVFNPIKWKLFSNDVFNIDENDNIIIVHSSVRSSSPIPGVLVISDNKTYGRNKYNRLLYKCIPDDSRLPPFLVPYEIKHVGFSKIFLTYM